jgi:P27 family predicted phage terminase small subunit
MAGRPTIAPQIKMLRGNPGKRPIPTDNPVGDVVMPDMPLWLKAYPIAVREWKREVKILYDMNVMTNADVGVLANRCYIASEIQILSQLVAKEGYTNVDAKTGIEKSSPKVGSLQRYLAEYRTIGSILGLDPTARNKVHTEKKKDNDPFDTF